MNNKCCEEMAVFVDSVKQVPMKVGVGLHLFEESDSPAELLIPVNADSCLPTVIFRFCPYCGKALDRERLTVTKGDLLGALRKAVALADASKMGSPLRRTAELEEAIDRVQSIVNAATTDNFEG